MIKRQGGLGEWATPPLPVLTAQKAPRGRRQQRGHPCFRREPASRAEASRGPLRGAGGILPSPEFRRRPAGGPLRACTARSLPSARLPPEAPGRGRHVGEEGAGFSADADGFRDAGAADTGARSSAKLKAMLNPRQHRGPAQKPRDSAENRVSVATGSRGAGPTWHRAVGRAGRAGGAAGRCGLGCPSASVLRGWLWCGHAHSRLVGRTEGDVSAELVHRHAESRPGSPGLRLFGHALHPAPACTPTPRSPPGHP